LVLGYYSICFGGASLPSLEGRVIKVTEDNSFLVKIKKEMSTEFHRKLKFETKKDPHINVGVSTKITPYYAKLKYLLEPEDEYSLYYLLSMGANLVEGEEIDFNKFFGDIEQSLNYGIGVGITIKNIELEILYGKYNYQILGAPQQEDKNFYSSTKLTFNCKYRF